MKNLNNALKNETDLQWKRFIENPCFYEYRFLHHIDFRPRRFKSQGEMLFQLIKYLRVVYK